MKPLRPGVRPETVGVLCGIAAYASWGAVPVFWRWLTDVPVLEVGAHRTVWGCVTFWVLLALGGRTRDAVAALRDRRALRMLAGSAVLLAINWLTFIYAVAVGRLVHASLGYFINPLFSVLLGTIVLRERLRPMQWLALLLAASGVVVLAMRASSFPWIALVLACSFALYGLVRKTTRVDALPGSTIEAVVLVPVALVYLAWLQFRGTSSFGTVPGTSLLLATSGLVTALPLLWFAMAARRVRLSTLGFMQYVAPTGQFLLAVLAFGEPLSTSELRGFGLIWIALALYSFDSWRNVPPKPT